MVLSRRELLIYTGAIIGGGAASYFLDRQRRLDQCVQKNLRVLSKIVGGRPTTEYEQHTVRQSCERQIK
ncbi:MAG: hypothetical protein M1575_04150 [Patescibacteria group bacterium]|nr:hypothetical protein [Patescibacteria group bacterium]MCL5095882.1 hypothetical protein [Patescibacteria group bacterium]